MIIDCHGHYTTAPSQLGKYREQLIYEFKNKIEHSVVDLNISDDEIKQSIESNQLRLQTERGTDLTVISPRASWMGHHIGNSTTSKLWTEQCNNLIKRICDLYPNNFVGVCQLPQSKGTDLSNSIAELERCVDMGFIGCNINPDPSGGHWSDAPPLTDEYWYPLYEKMIELEVPGMIHTSASCCDCLHTTTSYYLGADTTAFTQLVQSKLFDQFPKLKLIVPHGGGAVPYHWGRYKAICEQMHSVTLEELIKDNIYFDTCVYDQNGMELLFKNIPHENILFASEMLGAVKHTKNTFGDDTDDTKKYIDRIGIDFNIFEHNAKLVYKRLDI